MYEEREPRSPRTAGGVSSSSAGGCRAVSLPGEVAASRTINSERSPYGPDRRRRPSPELPAFPPGSSSCGRDTRAGWLETRAPENHSSDERRCGRSPTESRCAAHSLIARTPKAMAMSIPSANDTQPAAVSPSTSPLSRPSAIDRSVREGSPGGPQSYEARERWPRLSASRKGGRHTHAYPFSATGANQPVPTVGAL